MNEPPKDAIRFPNPPQFHEHDDTPDEYAVEIRDDVPGGCIIWVFYHDEWSANEGSKRALVRMLLTEQKRLRELVGRAVRGLKCIGSFTNRIGTDPHPLDCSLAGRVSQVFCTGMTRSIELCREFGQDPDHKEPNDGL